MEYLCSVCGKKVPGDMMVYMDHTERHVIDLIKMDHPEWVEKDGACRKCVEYYKGELKGGLFGDAKCAQRRRKLRSLFSFVGKFFNRLRQ